MNGERWRQVDKIFKDLIEQTPEERALFLGRVCAGDPLLKKEVEDLIQAYERAGSFLNVTAQRSTASARVYCCEFGVYRHVRFGGCNVSLGVRVPLAP